MYLAVDRTVFVRVHIKVVAGECGGEIPIHLDWEDLVADQPHPHAQHG